MDQEQVERKLRQALAALQSATNEIAKLKSEVQTLKDKVKALDKGLSLTQRLVNGLLTKAGFKQQIDV